MICPKTWKHDTCRIMTKDKSVRSVALGYHDKNSKFKNIISEDTWHIGNVNSYTVQSLSMSHATRHSPGYKITVDEQCQQECLVIESAHMLWVPQQIP